MQSCKDCKKDVSKKGLCAGILYGIFPHFGCILFIVFTIFGVTAASAFLMPLLVNVTFLYGLIALSFVFATVSAIFYLKQRGKISFESIKENYRYLLILYGTAIFVNVIMFLVIFPMLANLGSSRSVAGVSQEIQSVLTLEVDIPCSGHAFLVIGDVSKIEGVYEVKYTYPDIFDVYYDSEEILEEEILSAEIFEEFSANVK